MLPLTVEVVEGTEMGPVFYKIDHVRDGRAWMVQQRFSTLHAMRDTLYAENAELPDAAFPPKQWPLIHLWQAPCTPALPADEMEARRSGLQTYLTELSGMKESWDSGTVKEVLCYATSTVDVAPPAAASASVQAAPRAATSTPIVKVVSWMDQQQPTAAATSETTEAASALLSLATSPPIRPGMGIDSSAAPLGDTSGASPRTVGGGGTKGASEKHQAGKKKRRSALVRSFDALVSATATSKASTSKTAAAAVAAEVKKSGAVTDVADIAAPALADIAETGSRGRSSSVAEYDSSSPLMSSSRGGETETVPAVVAPTETDAVTATASTVATTASATSPVTQPLEVTVDIDAVAPSAVTPRPAEETREVPGGMLLSAVIADVDSRVAGAVVPAPISDQSLLTPSAKAAYATVAGEEGGTEIAREREEASAVSALGLSSASEEAGDDDGAATLVASTSASTESLPTPATPAAQKRRSSLLGRAKRSLSSKKSGDKDKDKAKAKEVPKVRSGDSEKENIAEVPSEKSGDKEKDSNKEVPLSSLGVEAPALPVPSAPMTPGSAAAAPRTPGRLASIRDRARSLKGRFSTSAGGGGGGGASGPLSLASAKSKGKGFFSMSTASPEGADVLPPPVALPEVDTTGKRDYVMAVAFSPVSLSSPPSPPNVGMVKVNSGKFMAVGGKTEAFDAPPSPGGD